MEPVVAALATSFGLTFGLASLLLVATRKLAVAEDPRIDEVEGLLPAANCGACGHPGCRSFAEALVRGDVQPAACTVSSVQGRGRVAAALGVEVGVVERRVARLACAGGRNVAAERVRYRGVPSCSAAAAIGGGKACVWGCLGLADCATACAFGAITMSAQGLPVVDEARCTACGDCVVACPKDLFSIHPADRRLWVACSSRAHGDDQLVDCEVACTACARCAKDAPEQVRMDGPLAVVSATARLSDLPTQRCPTGALVWLTPDGPVRGAAAVPLVRIGPRPPLPT